MKKTLAQQRSEDAVFYGTWAEQHLKTYENIENSPEVRRQAFDRYNIAMRALEVSKLDPIAAYRVFYGIVL
jgi:hypothetical protein